MSRSGAEIYASEAQSRLIQDRISKVETHFGELCSSIASYGRKESRVRDKGDNLSKVILNYAEHEQQNHTTQEALRQFAYDFAAVQDYRDAEVKRIEDRVVKPLTQYGDVCKIAKERLKAAFVAHEKELKQQKNANKIRSKNPSDRHQISQAEEEAHRASAEASQSSRALEDKIEEFEGKKLVDIKKILTDFVNIEMVFHAKALERLGKCFEDLKSIREDEDLEEFRNSLRPGNHQIQNRLQRSTSKNSLNSSYNSTMQTAPLRNTSTSQPNSRPGSARPTPNMLRRNNSYTSNQHSQSSNQPSNNSSHLNSQSSHHNSQSSHHNSQSSHHNSQSSHTRNGINTKSNADSSNYKDSDSITSLTNSDESDLSDDDDYDENDIEDDDDSYEDHYTKK